MSMMKRIKWITILGCILLIALAGGVIAINLLTRVDAATVRYGTVTGNAVNVRTGAGTTNAVLTTAEGAKVQLSTGHSVVINGEAKASDGSTWYKINFTYSDGKEYSGYIHSMYVTTYEVDESFDKYLESQGFPDSYKQGLQALHSIYPEWIFVADHLDYTWEEALAGQSVLGRSLVSASSIKSYKSTATGAYNWKTNQWTTFDGTAWNAASEEIIAYCMDPRNFFDAAQIFQFELLSYDSGVHTSPGVQNVIKGSFMDGASIPNDSGKTITYLQALMDAAKSSGVSPYHLASRILQEVGTNGASNSISGTVSGYVGYYNYYNIGAYAANGNSAIVNGLIYAKGGADGKATTYGRPWNTRYKAILGGASYIGSGYINVGQDTLYYEKFDYVGSPYTHQYMTNIIAPQSEASKMAKAYSDEMKKSTSFTFKIPVFKDMPEKAAAKPTADTSPNNYLSSLSVTGQTLSPSFDGAVTSYSIVVKNSVSSITVSAKAVDSTAKISGTGQQTLKVGENTITVAVTAENGKVRNYKIIVIREGSTTPSVDPTVTMKYSVLDTSYLKGFTVGEKVSSVLGNVKVQNGTASVTNSSGTKKQSGDVIATGDKLIIYDSSNTVYKTYEIVIFGDINGDGVLDLKDLLKYKNVILGKITLSNVYKKSGDTNRDGRITIVELLKMKNQILGKELISQN